VERITSTRNSRVKDWAALKQKKFRETTGLFLIEGIRIVEDALESNAPIETVLVQEDLIPSGKADKILNLLQSQGLELIEVTQPVIEHMSDTKTPQGVIAVGRQFQHDPVGLISGKENPLYLIIDSIQDPGNLGTMIRSADAVGATGVFVGSDSVDIYNPKVLRATMGSLFHLPVLETPLSEIFQLLKQNHVKVVGTSTEAEKDLFGADLTGGTAIVIGSEAHGISEEIRQYIDTWTSVPMPGKAESLNAAIASSVILYEALRQRKTRE
jgi:TrmH family RNA methyltransferase